jgi:hypothetical protein
MYEELVEEFDAKKMADKALVYREQKVLLLANELGTARNEVENIR